MRLLAAAAILILAAAALLLLYVALAEHEAPRAAAGVVAQLKLMVAAVVVLVALAGLLCFLIEVALAQLSAAEAAGRALGRLGWDSLGGIQLALRQVDRWLTSSFQLPRRDPRLERGWVKLKPCAAAGLQVEKKGRDGSGAQLERSNSDLTVSTSGMSSSNSGNSREASETVRR